MRPPTPTTTITTTMIDDDANNTNYNDATFTDDTDTETDTDTDSTTSTSSPSCPPTPTFPLFPSLPPELRIQIWRLAAVPAPGINFFNVHAFPCDHAGCNRCTSPPWLYLDLRRQRIADPDAAVSRYDPSAFQARAAVRATCREARDVCAIPADRAAELTLTKPARGLYVRAGDGELRNTPAHLGPRPSDGAAPWPMPWPVQRTKRRRVRVHVDDVLCLCVENCSFNLPFEERQTSPPVVDNHSTAINNNNNNNYYHHNSGGSGGGSGHDEGEGEGEEESDDVESDYGWSYDPQLTPALPASIRADRVCAGLARCAGAAPPRATTDALVELLYAHVPGYFDELHVDRLPGRLLVMFDSVTLAIEEGQDLGERTATPEVVWDRFGDCYVRLPWRARDFRPPFPLSRLIKVSPETCDIRERYLRSAIMTSSKRPSNRRSR